MTECTQPSITVLIPTRERAGTLPVPLESCLAQEYENLEILVSDNCSTDETAEVIAEFQRRDPRVRSVRTSSRVSMRANFEFGITHATGDYLIIIGDDDAVMPGGIAQLAQIIIDHPHIDAFGWACCFYYYPKSVHDIEHSLFFSLRGDLEVRDSRLWLQKVLSGKANFTQLAMPYHGCMATRLYDRIRGDNDTFIHSNVPDVYLTIAAASLTEQQIRVPSPITLLGSSSKGNGSSLAQGSYDKHASFNKYVSEFDMPVHPLINDFIPDHGVIAVESALQARDQGLLPSDCEIDWSITIARAIHCGNMFYKGGFRDEIAGAVERLAKRTDSLPAFDRWNRLTKDGNFNYDIATKEEIIFWNAPAYIGLFHDLTISLQSAGVVDAWGAAKQASLFANVSRQLEAVSSHPLGWQFEWEKKLHATQTALKALEKECTARENGQ